MTEPKKVQCPGCIAEGRRSTVEIRSIPVFAMGVHRYYDEDGNRHNHDPNGSGFYYACSNGHEWAPEWRPCPSCDDGMKAAWLREGPLR